jgi:hypothetical protein
MWKMIELNLTKLERGTKKEWKTVTRGGKTFKQRFATGEKESEPTGTTMSTVADLTPKKASGIDRVKACGWDAGHSKLYAGYVADKAHVFMENKVVIAMSVFDIKGNTLDIDTLEVNPTNRRQGKGVETMKNIVRHAIDNNVEKITLESMNDDSDKFYNAIGMLDRGKSKFPGRAALTCYEGDQEWMRKFIKTK